MINDEETISVLYNKCYGGFGVSEKAIDLYNQRMKDLNPEHKYVDTNDEYYFYYENKIRSNPILVQIYNELGKEFNRGKYNNIKIYNIPKKYENHYTIEKYDGYEDVIIEIEKYKLDNIEQIVKNTNISSDEKINEIIKFLNDK